jgi:hypothetical protein
MPIRTFSKRVGLVLIAALIVSVESARADVSVNVNGNIATAQIALPSTAQPTYTATVTITFDSVVNLTRGSLNLTAQMVNPGTLTGLPLGVAVDPDFPVLVSVEPPVPLFMNSFEPGEVGDGALRFFDTYEMEIHTADLVCGSSSSTYRLYKAPHGSTNFRDVTDGLYAGSVRARGRGGAFSQFLIVRDQQLLGLVGVATQKLGMLLTRLQTSSINGTLLTTLTMLLEQVTASLLPPLNISGAISALNTFIEDVKTGAQNGDIANEWVAGGSSSNDAGDLISLAQTLNFSLQLLQGAPVCQTASN